MCMCVSISQIFSKGYVSSQLDPNAYAQGHLIPELTEIAPLDSRLCILNPVRLPVELTGRVSRVRSSVRSRV
jgi:hypothetical protein